MADEPGSTDSMSDNVIALSRYAGFVGGDVVPSSKRPPLTAHIARLPDPRAIPPREWMYGTILVRKFASVLIAPGGVGKTAVSCAIGVSIALGRGLIGDWVHVPANVLMMSLEDPEDEFDRRLAATLIHHHIDPDLIRGKIHVECGRDRRLVVAQYSPHDQITWFPDKPLVTEYCKDHSIGVIVVDPFVNSHEVDENSNAQMNAAVRAWAEIANDCNCSVLLIHHTRKGAVAGQIEDSRGAVSLIGGSRAAFTLTAMTKEEAEGFGITDRDRRLHIRLDDGKGNLAPPAEVARWFRLASVPLCNQNEIYKFGDNVQAVEPWKPPSVFKEMTQGDLDAVLDLLSAGPTPTTLYSATKRGANNARWAGAVLMDVMNHTETQAKQVISQWLKTGVLVETQYRDTAEGKTRTGVNVDRSKLP